MSRCEPPVVISRGISLSRRISTSSCASYGRGWEVDSTRGYINVQTVLPYASGTESEFENAMEAFKQSGRPDLLVYRRTEMPLFPAEPPEEMEARMRQWQALKSFCERWFRDSTENTFTTAFNTYQEISGDFERAFEEHLKHLVEERLTQDGAAAEAGPRRERWWQGSPVSRIAGFRV